MSNNILKEKDIDRCFDLCQFRPDYIKKYTFSFIDKYGWSLLVELLIKDEIENNWNGHKLDWKIITDVLVEYLDNSKHEEAIKKAMPSYIVSKKTTSSERAKAKNIFAKYMCFKLFGKKQIKKGKNTYKLYRKFMYDKRTISNFKKSHD